MQWQWVRQTCRQIAPLSKFYTRLCSFAYDHIIILIYYNIIPNT